MGQVVGREVNEDVRASVTRRRHPGRHVDLQDGPLGKPPVLQCVEGSFHVVEVAAGAGVLDVPASRGG